MRKAHLITDAAALVYTFTRAALFLAAIISLELCPIPAHAASNTLPAMITQQYGLTDLPLVVETDYTVGTSAVQVNKFDAARIEDVFINLGTAQCEVKHSANVTTTSGYVLTANGGTVAENWRDDLTIPTLEAWSVCAAAAQTVHVIELKLQ